MCGPGAIRQCVWDVIVMAEIAAMEMGRRLMVATLGRRGDQGEPGLDAGVELSERRVRRAVTHFYLGPLTQAAEARMGFSGSPPPNSKGDRNGTGVFGAVV